MCAVVGSLTEVSLPIRVFLLCVSIIRVCVLVLNVHVCCALPLVHCKVGSLTAEARACVFVLCICICICVVFAYTVHVCTQLVHCKVGSLTEVRA